MTLAKRTLRHPGTRPLAWLLLGAVSALTFSWGVAPPRAEAQELVARTAVILDFSSLAAGGQMLGRVAAASMALSMTERQYLVRSRNEVVDAATRLGLREPYEPDEIRALAADLDAREVVTGQVLSITEGDGPPQWAKALLRVEVYDGDTGDLVNGAITEGYEQGTPISRDDRDTLRAEAVNRAVAKALDRIEARTLIRAIIVHVQPNRGDVLINRGSRHGVTKGMEFDILRGILDPATNETKQVKVGRIRVTRVETDEADGTVIEAQQGYQLNDRLREVFRLPSVAEALPEGGRLSPPTGGVQRGGKPGSLGSLLAPVLGVVAGAGLLLVLLSMQENTVTDSPRVSPRTDGFLRQSAPGANPSVVVQWGDRDIAPPANFIGGYVVYRSTAENFAAIDSEAIGVVAGGSQRNYSDEPRWEFVRTTVPVRFTYQAGEDIEEVTEDLNMEIVHQSPQPGITYFYKVRRIGPPSIITPPTLITSRSADSRAARRDWARAIARGEVLRPGGNILRVERTNRVTRTVKRQVTSIPPGPTYDTTLDPADDNDLDLDNDVGLSNASLAIGPVTYLVPPDLLSPNNNNQAQQVDSIGFQFQGVLGASEYVLQISRNFNFSPVDFESQRIQTTASSVLSFQYGSGQAGFVPLTPNTTYFWRVGARTTFANQATPQPDGYVYSSRFTFTTADQPPAAP